MKIYLIRHGLTKANEKKLYCGHTDYPLSKQGRLELEQLKSKSGYSNDRLYFTSPMKRCVETLNILYNSPKIQAVLPDLKEMNFGDFEGKDYETLKDNSDYREWIDHYETVIIPNGESYQEFKQRVSIGYERVVNQYKNRAKTLIIVTHGGVIRAIMGSVINPNIAFFDWKIPYGRGYIIDTETNSYKPIDL